MLVQLVEPYLVSSLSRDAALVRDGLPKLATAPLLVDQIIASFVSSRGGIRRAGLLID